jgi:hypothetical protein
MLSELLNADVVWDVRRVRVTIVVSGYEAENKKMSKAWPLREW